MFLLDLPILFLRLGLVICVFRQDLMVPCSPHLGRASVPQISVLDYLRGIVHFTYVEARHSLFVPSLPPTPLADKTNFG